MPFLRNEFSKIFEKLFTMTLFSEMTQISDPTALELNYFLTFVCSEKALKTRSNSSRLSFSFEGMSIISINRLVTCSSIPLTKQITLKTGFVMLEHSWTKVAEATFSWVQPPSGVLYLKKDLELSVFLDFYRDY